MLVRVGIENDNDDRSIGWALEHPGCFAYGADAAGAQAAMHQAVCDYADWIGRHEPSWLPGQDFEIRVEESFASYFVDAGFELTGRGPNTYMVESFFRHDWKPLTALDVERARKLLAWSRADLLDTVAGLSATALDASYPGERWSINGILRHIGGAEWWYQERIGLPFPEREQDVPNDPFERLDVVRAHFLQVLPGLAGLSKVIGLDGEIWSPRKVLRRALWHERDHTQHIRKLLDGGAHAA
ncbi:MAG: DinB family protein [Anaerolineae bacterium]